jgi:type II secretory pathway pseudopilin PulG
MVVEIHAETVGYVALAGMLSAVAIPSFMKYARKAKTVEATIQVKKLVDGARAAAAADTGHKLPRGTVGPTPPLGACCRTGGKCQPDPRAWTDPVWKALRFDMDDPHYYSYSYSSDGRTFVARANGDLNCDGVYSTFELRGEVDGAGNLTGGAGMTRDHELE